MPNKRGNSNNELLGRIGERTENIQEDVRDIKLNQKEITREIAKNNTKLAILEDKDKNRVHIPKGTGWGKFIAGLIRLSR